MEPWQHDYAITDTFSEDQVFVPSTPACLCRLFRVQHDGNNPSHELAQVDAEKCVLVPLRPLSKGEEITFDYFGREEDELVSSYPVTDSSTEGSQSLSLSSQSIDGDSQVVLTGNGVTTTARLLRILEDKFKKIDGEEVCDSLAF